MFDRLDHIGLVVTDLDESIAFYEDTFKLEGTYREVLEEQQVEVVLLDVGESHVELLRPLSPETSCGRFLEKRGPGVHHVAYQVDDIVAALAELSASGVEVLDPVPRAGVRGTKIAFLHPRSVGGVLTEIIEQPHPGGDG